MNKYYIFNSLGSNYDLNFLLLVLRQIIWPIDERKKLERQLATDFEARQVVLTRQGRDAIQLALAAAGVQKGDVVLTQALSCYAIEEAILRTQATPVYVDIADRLNPTLSELKKAYRKNKSAKVIIIQHLLGVPAEMKEIMAWADQNKLVVIEDLAQSVGAKVDGKQVGMWGDLVILSFGRDKMIDAIAGGAVLARTNLKIPSSIMPSDATIKEKIYPWIASSSRWGYALGWGRLVFKVAKSLNWIWSPIESVGTVASSLPAFFASLVLYQYKRLDSSLKHRQQIGKTYHQNLKFSTKVKSVLKDTDLKNGSLQRYPLLIDKNNLLPLITFLKSKGIFISDRWYRSAVDCGSENCQTVYQAGAAPHAEQVAQELLNLPTHQYISSAKAEYVSAQINKFFEEYAK